MCSSDLYLILDAINNAVYVNPSREDIERLKKLEAQLAEEKAELAKLKDLPASCHVPGPAHGLQLTMGCCRRQVRNIQTQLQQVTFLGVLRFSC